MLSQLKNLKISEINTMLHHTNEYHKRLLKLSYFNYLLI